MSKNDLWDVVCEDGGRLRELFKSGRFGQVTMRLIPPGVTAGGHLHRETNELWWVFGEDVTVRLELPDGIRETYCVSGRSGIIRVPAGTGHEIANKGDEDALLVFHADRLYDHDKPDKEPWTSAS